jgi:hypothetical protein
MTDQQVDTILQKMIDLLWAGHNNIVVPKENEVLLRNMIKSIYQIGRLDQGKIDFANDQLTLRVVDDKGRVALVPPKYHFMDDSGRIRDIKEIFPRGT